MCLLDRVSVWGDEDARGVVGVVAQQRECVSCTYISLFWFQVREIDGVFQLTSDLKMLSMSSLGTAVSKNDDLKKKKRQFQDWRLTCQLSRHPQALSGQCRN